MRVTPCIGSWIRFAYVPPERTPYMPGKVYMHQRLEKKLRTLVECESYYSINFHMLHVWPKNLTHYFAECQIGQWIYRPGEIKKTWWPRPGRRQCFYLGRFYVLWSTLHPAQYWAHSMDSAGNYAIGTEPFIPTVDMGIFKDLPPDRWEHYISAKHISIYNTQKAFLEFWSGHFLKCLRDKYPTTPREPFVKTPYGTSPWPGTPLSQLKPPTPETQPPPLKDTKTGEEIPKTRLIIELSQQTSPPDPEDALLLSLVME